MYFKTLCGGLRPDYIEQLKFWKKIFVDAQNFGISGKQRQTTTKRFTFPKFSSSPLCPSDGVN